MKIGIIGIGGRTGTMFFQELKNSGEVFGIGKKEEIEKIKNKELFVEKNGKKELVEGNLIEENEFPKGVDFDFLFLTVKNPIGQVVKTYYQKIKERGLKIPTLFLSQNGIEASNEALLGLKEIFGEKEFPIFRISLFNPVEKKILNNHTIISYSLPIKMALAKISGSQEEKEINNFFKKANFKVFLISQKEAKNMEYSKLFLNLIGMASATKGLSVREGFSKKEVFLEEIKAMKEYITVVKAAKGKFLNFPGYPVKTFSFLFSLPPLFLFPLRKIFGKIIDRARTGKAKDLDEIDYYNGAVVKLGKIFNIKTPVNEEILKKVKNEKSLY